jgi:hypothetical protein
MRLRFVLRGFIVALALLIVGLLWVSYNAETVIRVLPIPGLAAWPTPGPIPPQPTITAPRGDLPQGHAGLVEWVKFYGQTPGGAGCGFLLRLPNGEIIGVTTAHSLYFSGWPGRALESVFFSLPGSAEAIVSFDAFYGRPGEVFTQYRFAKDYVLLKTTQPVDETLILDPDPRGAPQAGERVSLYSGLGDGAGEPRAWEGTITAVGPEAVWAQMDEQFDPGGMSGSPLLSQHTGQVVGMVVSGGGSPVMLGFHPIGALVQKAESATEFPLIAEYRR